MNEIEPQAAFAACGFCDFLDSKLVKPVRFIVVRCTPVCTLRKPSQIRVALRFAGFAGVYRPSGLLSRVSLPFTRSVNLLSFGSFCASRVLLAFIARQVYCRGFHYRSPAL
jgi:hypothetical protein